MIIKRLEVGPLGTNCYILGCKETLEGAVIDPGGNGEFIIRQVETLKLKLKYIINTHGHGDHIGANKELKDYAPDASLVIHKLDADYLLDARKNMTGMFGKPLEGLQADRLLEEGDILRIGNIIKLKVIHTPGHTPGGICLDSGEHLFTGDTLFAGSIGRTDFPGGSYQALIENVETKLFTLAGDRKVWPGHGPESSLFYEKQHNPFFR